MILTRSVFMPANVPKGNAHTHTVTAASISLTMQGRKGPHTYSSSDGAEFSAETCDCFYKECVCLKPRRCSPFISCHLYVVGSCLAFWSDLIGNKCLSYQGSFGVWTRVCVCVRVCTRMRRKQIEREAERFYVHPVSICSTGN